MNGLIRRALGSASRDRRAHDLDHQREQLADLSCSVCTAPLRLHFKSGIVGKGPTRSCVVAQFLARRDAVDGGR